MSRTSGGCGCAASVPATPGQVARAAAIDPGTLGTLLGEVGALRTGSRPHEPGFGGHRDRATQHAVGAASRYHLRLRLAGGTGRGQSASTIGEIVPVGRCATCVLRTFGG